MKENSDRPPLVSTIRQKLSGCVTVRGLTGDLTSILSFSRGTGDHFSDISPVYRHGNEISTYGCNTSLRDTLSLELDTEHYFRKFVEGFAGYLCVPFESVVEDVSIGLYPYGRRTRAT